MMGCDASPPVAAGPAGGDPTAAVAAPSLDGVGSPARGHRARPAPTQVDAERPVELGLPGGTRLPVDVAVTGADGVLQLPQDVGRAGWWQGGSRLGDPFGALVVAGHVDSFVQGVGPFAELNGLGVGDEIELVSATHRQLFRVRRTRVVERVLLSADVEAFSAYGPLRLVLITCGGPYDAATGGYRDNIVVVAAPSGRPVAR